MYILDSDVLGFYLNHPDNYPYLSRKIDKADAQGLLCTSIVTIEEAVAGKISYILNKHVSKKHRYYAGIRIFIRIYEGYKKFFGITF